ncbi:hypothetical protein DFH09DRAFT_968674 [Mycena vulgaris]|nr:hypothetical protein DFH09DRAFT_968674 [Mycena vulgaris]
MHQHTPTPLDETLYQEEDVAFIQEETGIEDADALKKHVIAVQKKAYALHWFPCIRNFEFAMSQISTLPSYREVLKLGREREGAILLDLGCCCGTDIRKVARDGFPTGNLIASDIIADFWDIGHELFQSSPETFHVVFLPGDALDPEFLEPCPPLTAPSKDTESPPPLISLTSLTPLRGHVSAIHVSSVFHLFSEKQQLHLARALGGLLSPCSGSMIFGCHIGQRSKGVGLPLLAASDGRQMFCHSPDSWCEMWESVFPQGTMKVDAELGRTKFYDGLYWDWLTWTLTRI